MMSVELHRCSGAPLIGNVINLERTSAECSLVWKKMSKMMSACGVICSECTAYFAAAKGIGHQRRTTEAWRRIYGLSEAPENISCGGCLGPNEDLFHTSQHCRARFCCLGKGFNNCAECPDESCEDLEMAQSVWDEVPHIGSTLSRTDFVMYARSYCGHRRRLAVARATRRGG
jgi:hypothetical protein